MFLIVLDHTEGKVIVEEITYITRDELKKFGHEIQKIGLNIFTNYEEYIAKKYHNNVDWTIQGDLEIQINEVGKDTVEIITKLDKRKVEQKTDEKYERLKENIALDIQAGNFDLDQEGVATEYYKKELGL